jgi:two-component system cell cycle response regulator DivK
MSSNGLQPAAATQVLLVEDNPQNLKYAQLVLGKGGYAVLTATNGEAALQVARTHRPRLVVMDVQMPVMDGLTATRLLKQDAATAGIKVLALTALAMKGDEERILAAGCDAYLTKPFQYQELLDAVRALLNQPGS